MLRYSYNADACNVAKKEASQKIVSFDIKDRATGRKQN